MPGLVPGIHVLDIGATVDGRDKPGHDGRQWSHPLPSLTLTLASQGAPRRPRRAADDEAGREDDLLRRLALLGVDPTHQQFGRGLAHFALRQPDRRQIDAAERGESDVVEPDDRQIARDAHAQLMRGLDDAEGIHVVAGDDRGGRLWRLQHHRRGVKAALGGVVAGIDQAGIGIEAELGDRVAEHGQALRRGGRFHRPAHEPDPRMAELHQMPDRGEDAAAIVGADIILGEGRAAPLHQHAGRPRLHHAAGLVRGGVLRDQHDAVHAPRQQRIHVCELDVLAAIGVAEQQGASLAHRDILDPAHEIGKGRIGDVGDQHADGVGAARSQRPGER